MTEREWLACGDPGPMLEFLVLQRERQDSWIMGLLAFFGTQPAIVSDRKLRLFLCACSRRQWGLFPVDVDREAVEVAEMHADGQASDQMLRDSLERAEGRPRRYPGEAPFPPLGYWVGSTCLRPLSWVGDGFSFKRQPRIVYAAGDIAGNAAHHLAPPHLQGVESWRACLTAESRHQADLMREVVGNPFRRSSFTASWRTPAAASISQVAYEERSLPGGHLDKACLAVLSDALEEAVCADEAILAHLRSPGPHVRGCWALDTVLGKE